MTNYTAFEIAFLIAAYQITEERGEEYILSGDVVSRSGQQPIANWISRAVRGLEEAGYARDVQFQGNDASIAFELTAAGVKRAEAELQELEAQQPDLSAKTIDSSSWTGLPSNFNLTWDKRERLIELLIEAEAEIESLSLSNSAKSQLRGYVVASRALADAPEPQADLIWEMLHRANSMAGIASFFVSIMALFTAAAH